MNHSSKPSQAHQDQSESTTAIPADQITEKSEIPQDFGTIALQLANALASTPIYAAITPGGVAIISLDQSAVQSYVETYNRHCEAHGIVPAVVIEGRFSIDPNNCDLCGVGE